MAAAKFDGPMEYPVEGYVPIGLVKDRMGIVGIEFDFSVEQR